MIFLAFIGGKRVIALFSYIICQVSYIILIFFCSTKVVALRCLFITVMIVFTRLFSIIFESIMPFALPIPPFAD